MAETWGLPYACFGAKMGWERPLFFAPAGAEPSLDYPWGKPAWLPWSSAEQRATRGSVAVPSGSVVHTRDAQPRAAPMRPT